MGKSYSMDLRERVVAAIDKGGLSCHRAAAQFGVGVNTLILWVSGSAAATVGAKLLFLPKYFARSEPDRAGLRQAQASAAQRRRANRPAIRQLLPAFIPKECANYFENAGCAST